LAVEYITTLTGYSGYGYGSTITYADNVAAANITPGNVYYYAVTSIDKYATDQANRIDTAFGSQPIESDGYIVSGLQNQLTPDCLTRSAAL